MKLRIPLLNNAMHTLANWGAEIRAKDFLSEKEDFDTWVDWVPVYSASGALTFTPTTTTIARYKKIGKIGVFTLLVTGTTGGVVNTSILFTLPFNGKNLVTPFTAFVNDGGGVLSGTAYLLNDNQVTVGKYDASNYGLGVGRSIRVAGFLELL